MLRGLPTREPDHESAVVLRPGLHRQAHRPLAHGGRPPRWSGQARAAGQSQADFVQDTDVARWLPKVHGFDAVGVLRDTAARPLQPVHETVPRPCSMPVLWPVCAAWCSETLAVLAQDNVGPAEILPRLLGRPTLPHRGAGREGRHDGTGVPASRVLLDGQQPVLWG